MKKARSTITPLPALTKPSAEELRSMAVGDVRVFAGGGASLRYASCLASRIKGLAVELKTAIVVDPITGEGQKILFVTRTD